MASSGSGKFSLVLILTHARAVTQGQRKREEKKEEKEEMYKKRKGNKK